MKFLASIMRLPPGTSLRLLPPVLSLAVLPANFSWGEFLAGDEAGESEVLRSVYRTASLSDAPSSTIRSGYSMASSGSGDDLLTVEAADSIGIVEAVDGSALPGGSAIRIGTFDFSQEGDASAFFAAHQNDLSTLNSKFTKYGSFSIGDAPSGAPAFFESDGSFKVTFEGDFNISEKPVFIWAVDTDVFPSEMTDGLGMGIFSGTGTEFGNEGTEEDPQLHTSSLVNSMTLNPNHFDLAYVGSRNGSNLTLAQIPEPLHFSGLAGLAGLAALCWRRRNLFTRSRKS